MEIEGSKRGDDRRANATAGEISTAGPASEAEHHPSPGAAYVEQLRIKYLSRITFQTPYSRQAVMDFSIDCKARDGRSLPLINVMLAKLNALDGKKMWATARVDSRGEDVRVYDQLVQDGRLRLIGGAR